MAGNHTTKRIQSERLMLVAFVVVVCWSAVEAWRPTQCIAPQSTYSIHGSTRRSALIEMLGSNRAPGFRWLVQKESYVFVPPDVEVELPTVEPSTNVWKPVTQTSPSVCFDHGQWIVVDIDQPASVSQVATPQLLEPTHPHAQWFAKMVRQGDLSHPAWQLTAPPEYQSLCATSVSLFYNWLHAGRYLAGPADSQLYASPPSLLTRSIVTDSNDRLAMIPHSKRTRHRQIDSRTWDELLVDSARPYLANGLEATIDSPLLVAPTSLIVMLENLAIEPHCAHWAAQSLSAVKAMVDADEFGLPVATEGIARLAYCSQQAELLAQQTDDPGLATRLRRARYALWRRVDVWRAVTKVVSPSMEQLVLAEAQLDESSPRAVRATMQSPVDVRKLLHQLEQVESQAMGGKSAERNGEVAIQIAQLAQSPIASRQALADTLSANYRNANARIAVTDDLINRFILAGQPRVEPIRDRVLGTPVSGTATTKSAATAVLLPDESSWRIGLELTGQADSQTVALERTVRVRTTGTTRFAGRQQVVIDGGGVHLGPVIADANSTSQFRNASSEYDPLPFVGSFVRSRAASAFTKRRTRAQNEVAAKAKQRVQQEMDRAVRAAADRAGVKWQSRVVEPLAAGGVEVEPVEMRTTAERLIARVRIANKDSLSAHTPRPRAPSDSLASCQLHQSAITNIASSLNLAGQRLTAQQFADRLLRFAPDMPYRELDEDARNAEILFADETPVTFELVDGSLHIAWEIQELVVRKRSNRNFKVHVYYTPSTTGLVARFDHTKGPYLEGSMRNSQRLRLQTIFGKIFPPKGHLAIGTKVENDPRVAGLMITQLVIDDGWLGVAIGPHKPQRTAQLDRYAPHVW